MIIAFVLSFWVYPAGGIGYKAVDVKYTPSKGLSI